MPHDAAQPPPRTADVVVIGAGVMGCAIAFELSKAGRSVVVVDRGADAASGTTGSSSAIVRAHYSTWHGVTMAYESALTWMKWAEHIEEADERGSARFIQSGTLLLKGPDRHHETVVPLYERAGVPFKDLTRDQVLERLPILDMGSYWPPKRPADDAFWADAQGKLDGAVYTDWSGFVSDPQLATHNLQRAAEKWGARFLFRRTVTSVSVASGRVSGVLLDGVDGIGAPVVINAAGPHSARVNDMAGASEDMRVRTRLLRHEVHHVPAPAGFDYDREGFHVSDPDLGIDFKPEPGNQISVGSEGPQCDPEHWVDDPDDFNRRVTQAVWEPQVLRLARRIPSLTVPSRPSGIADLYDVTEDWVPIYDRSCIDGFFMAIGTSGNQFKNAPTVGYLMRSLVEACEAGQDHDSTPIRVPGRNLAVGFDLGVVSRLRTPDRASNKNAMG